MYVPRRIFLTKGVGIAKEKLTSFEQALRNADIACFNLVRVSSIFPPHCRIIPRSRGLAELEPGQIVHAVISDCSSNEPYRQMAASVGIAIPKDSAKYGYLSEHHSYGQSARVAGDFAEDLAAQMLATILGLPFDPDSSYDERKELWRISGEIVHTKAITEAAKGCRDGSWTTVLAAAILLP